MRFIQHNTFRRILATALPCVVLLSICMPHVAHADSKEIASAAGSMIVSMFSWLTWLGGWLLDYSTKEYVLDMGAFITQETSLGFTINETWAVIRDVCNLAFIFGFVYIGVRTILQNEGSDYKRFLARLIIAAVLVNFSLFFSKAVIDVSNLLTVEIYEAMVPEVNGERVGIAAAFANSMGIAELLTLREIDTDAFEKLDVGGMIAFYIGAAAFLAVAAYVFLSGAMFLLWRLVVLIVIMIFSPVLFAGTVFTQTGQYATKLWQMLLGNAFFAPIYFFMLLISLQVINGGGQDLGGNQFIKALLNTGTEPEKYGVVVKFIIITIFMLISLKVAKDVSGSVGTKITGVAQKATKGALMATTMATTFPARWAAREGVNRSAIWGEDKFKNWQAQGGDWRRWNLIDRAATSTLGAGKNFKAGQKYSRSELTEQNEDITRRTTQRAAEIDRKRRLGEANKIIDDASKSAEEFAKAAEDLGKVVRDMSVDEKVKLGMDPKKGGLTDQRVAVNLKESDIEALEKSGKLSAAQIQQIKDARKKGFENIAAHGDVRNAEGNLDSRGALNREFTRKQRQALMDRGPQEVGKLDHAILANANMRQHITPQIIEARMRNGGDMSAIRDSLNEYLRSAPESTRKVWRNWAERSTAGSSLGLNIPPQGSQGNGNNNQGNNNEPPPPPQPPIPPM